MLDGHPPRPVTPSLLGGRSTFNVQRSSIFGRHPATCTPRCILSIYKRGRLGRPLPTQDLPTHLASSQLTDVFTFYSVRPYPSLLGCSQWLIRSNHRSSTRSYNSRSDIPTISATIDRLNTFIALCPRGGRPVRVRIVRPLLDLSPLRAYLRTHSV